MMDLSIIIPAFNEALRIEPTIRQFHSFLSGEGISFEIIVVDDGSTDDTAALVTALQMQLPGLLVLSSPTNKGKGHAVRQGMLAASGRLRLFADADGSTPVEETNKLLQPLREGKADIAIGSRYVDGAHVVKPQPQWRVLWSRVVNRLVQRMLLPGVSDTHCGFKAFTADAAQQVFSHCTIDGWSFDLEVLAIARRMQLKIGEVPVKWTNDERSKGKIRHMPREVWNFMKIKRHYSSRMLK